MRQIFLEIEATGLSFINGDRIIEIASIEMVNLQPTGNNLHYYLNPQRNSHEDAIKSHGISDEFLLDKPTFGDIADDFLAYCAGADIFFQHAHFALPFLEHELRLLCKPAFKTVVGQITYNKQIAKSLFPNQETTYAALCERLGLSFSEVTPWHATNGAQLIADIYIKLQELQR